MEGSPDLIDIPTNDQSKIPENDARYVASPTITKEERSDFITQVKEKQRWIGKIDIDPAKFPGLHEETQRQLEIIRSKIIEIGIDNPDKYLPEWSQIQFKDGASGDIAGFCDLTGPDITIFLPHYFSLPNPDYNKTISHESAHFMKKYVLARRGPDQKISFVGAGFSKYHKHYNELYEEANAELFALFCANEDAAIDTPYPLHLCITIAMLNRFAKVKGIEPVEAFKKFFKANATRDFSFQREQVEVFGTEAVREFNRFSWWERTVKPKPGEQRITLNDLARLGGFYEDFDKLLTMYRNGQGISLPGMKGSFIKKYIQTPR